jgi:ATPase complex subunit ATP10
MGMTNSKVGYVYLVDENLKIRWGGCADATEREAQSLESCTGVLLKRLEEKLGINNPTLEGAKIDEENLTSSL